MMSLSSTLLTRIWLDIPVSIPAAIKAIETVDTCVGKAVEALKEVDGQMFICADHGNAEQMVDYETGAPFTAHTTNPVPFILVNADPSYTLQRERMPGRYYPDVNRTDGNGAAGRDDRKVTSGQKIKNRTRKAVPGEGLLFLC